MKTFYCSLVLLFLLAVSLIGVSAARADKEKEEMAAQDSGPQMILLTPDEITWVDVPPALPPGAKIAVLEGDPFSAAPYTIRLMLPADYKIPAHWHTMIERVSILSGTLYAGMGDKLDPEKSKSFPAGSFVFIPAKMNHFAWTDEDTIVQINGDGPFDIHYIDPVDDPRKLN